MPGLAERQNALSPPSGAEGILPCACRRRGREGSQDAAIGNCGVTTALGQAKFRVNRVFARAGDVQQEEPARDAHVFVEICHIRVVVGARHGPVMMPNKRGRQRIERQQHGERTGPDAKDDAMETKSSMAIATRAATGGMGVPVCAM